MDRRLLALLMLIFFIASGFASDIETDAEKDSAKIKAQYLDEVVVIYSKETQKLKNVPVSVSAFSIRKLRTEDIRSTKDLTAKVPNMYMPDYGSKINSPVYIRGIGSKTNAPSVGLYVDNMPFFEKCVYDIDLADIEHLEVLRGPQGTLYGRNAMGGIINIYTKSPFDYQGTRISLTNGNYGVFSGKVSNYSLLSDKLGLMISGNYTYHNGYYTNIYLNQKADRLNDAGGKFKLSFKPTQSLLIELSDNLNYSNQNGYPYALTDSLGKAKNIIYNQESGYKQLVNTSGLMLRYTMDNMLLTSTTSYQWFKDKQSIDQDFLSDSIYFVVQDMHQNMVSEEITLRSNSSSNYQWVIGAFGFIQAIRKVVETNEYLKKSITDKHYITDTKGFALYHQSSYNHLFIKGLSAGIGLRLDIESVSQNYISHKTDVTGSIIRTLYDSKLDFTEFVPKFNLSYRINPNQLVYGSIAKGYKTGGFNDLFQKDADRTFDPENSWNYELGYKFSFFNNKLKGDFTLFYIDWKNQQIQYLDPEYNPPIPIIKNAGTSGSKGFEVSLGYNPVYNLDIDFQYGYTYAVFNDYKKDAKTDYSSNYIQYIPKNTISLTANYTIIPSRDFFDRIVLTGQYNGIGSLYWEEANTNEQDYYSLVNARITFYKGQQSICLWSRNLMDTYYNAYLFSSAGNQFCQRGKPATFGVDLMIYF